MAAQRKAHSRSNHSPMALCCLLAALCTSALPAQSAARPGTDPLPAPEQTSKAVDAPLNPALPTLFLVGDSTCRNQADLGWGDHAGQLFDLARINVANRCIAGRSTRTYRKEGAWSRALAEVKPGDFVLIQMGHNDGGQLDGAKPRGSLKGVGEDTRDVVLLTGEHELVHSYGWYLRSMIAEARAKGATPVLLTLTVRNIWTTAADGSKHIERDMGYAEFERLVAKSEQVPLLDVATLEADALEKLGPEATAKLFPVDHTHTSAEGAALAADCVVKTLQPSHSPLAKYLRANSTRAF